MQITSRLRFKIDSMKTLGADPRATAVEQFILEHGALWLGRPLPDAYRPMTPKQCFDNAARLSLETGLTYVEGFAARADLPIEFRHAWLVDDGNQIVDPTWRDTDYSTEYIGVRVPRDILLREALRNECYGVLWRPPMDTPNLDALESLGGENAVRHLRERAPDRGASAARGGGGNARRLGRGAR